MEEKGKRKGKGIRVCAGSLIAIISVAGLTGCRDSTAFTRNIYNQDFPETVEGNMMENEDDNEETREDIWSVEEQESESLRDYSRTIAQYGESEEENDAESNDVSYNADADDLYTSGNAVNTDESSLDESPASTGGDSQAEGEDVEISYGTEGEEEDEGASDDADSSIDSVDTEPSEGAEDTDDAPDEEDTSDDGGVTVVDPDADVTKLPTGMTCAALGEAAVLAQMLGGEGTLVATSKSFKEENVDGLSAESVFSDELSDDLVYLGDIDTFSEISSSAFSDLLEVGPEVIFLMEEDSFTSAQEEELEDAGISLVWLEDLTEGTGSKDTAADHLLYDMEVIGKALGDRTEYGGFDAEKQFAEYEEWYDETLEEVETDSTLYTCYFSYYDEEVTITYAYAASDASISFEGDLIAPSGYIAIGAYALAAGVQPTNSYGMNFGWFSVGNQASLIYFQPYIAWISKKASGGLYESGQVGFFTANGTRDAYNNPYPLSKVSGSIYLGSASYPALLASTQYIEKKIEESRDNKGIFSGYYDADYFEYQVGSSIVTIANTDYDVYTVPCGIGSWADGSAESPLLSLWIAQKFYGTFEDSELKSYVQEFYEEFYRYDLSGSEAETILAGKEK